MVRLWEPGEIIMYSTYGITVGGLLIEDVTNQEYEKYMMHHIWKPLEMNSTNINVPGELKAKVALGYENVNGINIPQRWEWYHTTPASSINSTAEDMSHWMIAHLNQGRFEKGSLMSEKRMEEMLMHHESMHPAMYGMTYGFFEEYHNNLRFLHHGGNMAGFNSLVVLIPGKKEGFFFVSQHEGSSIRDHLQWAILDRYFKKQDSAVKIIPVSGDAVHRAGLFAGQYKQNTFCHSCERPTTSYTIDVSANADGTIQLNGRRWIESEQKLLFIREDGKSKIAFRSDSLNRITHMYFGGFWAFEKIK